MRGLWIVGLVFLGVACSNKSTLPDYGAVPAFQLTSQDSRPFSDKDLRGAPYIASFIYTTCKSICPMLTSQLKVLQRRLSTQAPRTRIVSISVDPERDTPEVLKQYARDRGADLSRWTFLTGNPLAVRSLVVGGFKQAIDTTQEAAGDGTPSKAAAPDIMHSMRFALVDGRGHIRGFFESRSDQIDSLIVAIVGLERESE